MDGIIWLVGDATACVTLLLVGGLVFGLLVSGAAWLSLTLRHRRDHEQQVERRTAAGCLLLSLLCCTALVLSWLAPWR